MGDPSAAAQTFSGRRLGVLRVGGGWGMVTGFFQSGSYAMVAPYMAIFTISVSQYRPKKCYDPFSWALGVMGSSFRRGSCIIADH